VEYDTFLRELGQVHARAGEPASTASTASNAALLGGLLGGTVARPGSETPAPAPADLADALHETVRMAARLLRADGAGLVLVDEAGAARWATATSAGALAFGQAERDLGGGPSADALDRDRTVWTRDVRADRRWPRLGPAASGHGVRAVLAAPVRAGGRPFATCAVVAETPRLWREDEVQTIGTLAAMTGRLLAVAAEAAQQRRLATQLREALDSRVVIEQAKGVLMERKGLVPSHAFHLLRQLARSSGRRVVDVAADVIANQRP